MFQKWYNITKEKRDEDCKQSNQVQNISNN